MEKRVIKFRGAILNHHAGLKWIYGYYSHEKKSGIHDIINDDGGRSVVPESVGQYVGLEDKNGKEIYEGDKTIDGVIEFNTPTCCYIIRRSNGTFIRLDVRKGVIEIIGNVYETSIVTTHTTLKTIINNQ